MKKGLKKFLNYKKNKKVFRGKNASLWRIFLVYCCLSIIIKAYVFFWYSPLGKDTYFTVNNGDVLSAVSVRLKKDGIIPLEFLFKSLIYFTLSANDVRRGDYMIPAGSSMWTVREIITSGKSFQYALTVPEGLTVKQISELLNADNRLVGKISVKVFDGDLLPNTYFFHRGATRDDVVLQMGDAMKKLIDDLWEKRSADKNILKNKEDVVVLASIVEKETRVPSERPIVASVLMNRLRSGMRLQMDPTVVYAITNGYGHMRGKALYDRHLEVDSPYNTYRYKGLPKGAICNPGIESIRAVLNPAMTNFLYFVADGNGGHLFAKTLDEHESNRQKWREYKKNLK